jgi:hypothetical protein
MRQRVPTDHPLRPIKESADQVLKELSRTFRTMYSEVGRQRAGGGMRNPQKRGPRAATRTQSKPAHAPSQFAAPPKIG